ncbi:MAG: ABC transporter permease [Planctomycetes bacterium]|nr:ABC transporter permease [Planctomycetota bacterium]
MVDTPHERGATREPLLPAFAGFLALRFLAVRRINLIGVIGIAVSVSAMIFVISLFAGFISDIRDSVRRVSPDVLVTTLPRDVDFADLDAALTTDDDVVSTAPRLRHYAMYRARGRRRVSSSSASSSRLIVRADEIQLVELIGVDPDREWRTTQLLECVAPFGARTPKDLFRVSPEQVEAWRIEQGLAPSPGLAVGTRPALSLGLYRINVGGLEFAEELSLFSASFREIDGHVELDPESKIVYVGRPFRTEHRVFDQTKALLDIDVLREDLLDYDPSFDPAIVTDVAVRVRDGADPTTVARRLQERLADRFGATCLTWEQQNQVYLDAVDQEQALMKLVLVVVMLVAAFLIYVTLHMLVTQKTREIGVLTALGASPGGVLKLFLFAGGVVATVGCALGVGLGLLAVTYANDLDRWAGAEFGFRLFPASLYALDQLPFHLEPGWVVQVVIGSLSVAALAAWLPARRAARFQPVRALASE